MMAFNKHGLAFGIPYFPCKDDGIIHHYTVRPDADSCVPKIPFLEYSLRLSRILCYSSLRKLSTWFSNNYRVLVASTKPFFH